MGFFSKCDQIRRKLQIWTHLLEKCFMENFIFRVMIVGVRSIPVDLRLYFQYFDTFYNNFEACL